MTSDSLGEEEAALGAFLQTEQGARLLGELDDAGAGGLSTLVHHHGAALQLWTVRCRQCRSQGTGYANTTHTATKLHLPWTQTLI